MSERSQTATSPDRGSANDLEATVLGHLWRLGPCTAYSVRKFFLDSPTSRFSGSTGAIYPLVARLESRGLIASTPVSQGRREGRHLAITAAGLETLRDWLLSPGGAEGAAYDPLRTQMLFLGALSGAERLSWFERAEAMEKAQMDRLIEHRSSYSGRDVYFELAASNALAHVRSRMAWLREARKTLSELPG